MWALMEDKAVVEGIPAVLETAEEIPLEKWVEYQKTLPQKSSCLPF